MSAAVIQQVKPIKGEREPSMVAAVMPPSKDDGKYKNTGIVGPATIVKNDAVVNSASIKGLKEKFQKQKPTV